MAYNTKNIIRDASGAPIPQFYNPAADAYQSLTGVDLGGGRYGYDGLIWGKTAGGLYVPAKVADDGTMLTQLTGSYATIGQNAPSTAVPMGGKDPNSKIQLPALINTFGDGISPTTYYPLAVAAVNYAFDGANSLDRWRNNTEGTLLASATRTATVWSPVQTNHNGVGVIVWLEVTVVSGTGGLQLVIQGINPVTGNAVQLNLTPTAITTTGRYGYEVGLGAQNAGLGVVQRTSGRLPRQWNIGVLHGDGSSYTYNVGYSLGI